MTTQTQPTLTINANFATKMRALARLPEWCLEDIAAGKLLKGSVCVDIRGIDILAKFPTRAAFDDMAATLLEREKARLMEAAQA